MRWPWHDVVGKGVTVFLLASIGGISTTYAQSPAQEKKEKPIPYKPAPRPASTSAQPIQYLEELLKVTPPNDPQYPELLYLAGETYYNMSQKAYQSTRALDDLVYEATQKKDTVKLEKLQKKQKTFEEQARTHRLSAFTSYVKIINDYPSYAKLDEVLFYTGYNLKELAQQTRLEAEILRDQGEESAALDLETKASDYEAKARNFYKTLIKDFPSSVFVSDAFLEFAEYYFSQNDVKNALKAYKVLTKYPKSRVYAYSLYKQGWCYFNMSDYKSALKRYTEVVEYSRIKTAKGDKSYITLEKEALKEIVRTYSKFGAPEKAKSFFQKIGGPDRYQGMLARLGAFYYETGAFLDSILVYEALINIDPKSNDNYLYQYEICLAAISLSTQNQAGAKERIVTELKTLSKMYEGMVSKKAPKEKQRDAKEKTASILREVAVSWHATAKTTEDTTLYAQARAMYEEYVKNFSDAKDIYTMTWNYAELLYRLGELGESDLWEKAGEMYQRVVELDPKGKYLKEAAFASVAAYQKALKGQLSYQAPPEEEVDLSPQPLPAREEKMLKAYQFYLQYAPKGEKALACKMEIGAIYYQYNQFDKAKPYFEEIVAGYPSDPVALYAARSLLFILKTRGPQKDFDKYVLQWRRDPLFSQDASFKDALDAAYAKIRGDECKGMEATRSWESAALCYAELVDELPSSDNHKLAIYNAAVSFEKAKKIGQAIKYRRLLIENYGDTEEGQTSIFALGLIHMNIAMYGKAAEHFEDFAQKFPGHKDARDALNNAAIFREGLGEYDLAVKDNKKYITVAKRQSAPEEEIAAAFFRIAQLREKEGNARKAAAAYEEYLTLFGEKGTLDQKLSAEAKLAAHLWKQGKREDSLARCQSVVDAVNALGTGASKLSSGLDAAAECTFYLAEREYEAFERIQLPDNFDKLGDWIKGMEQARSNASALYLKVKGYGSKGWTLAALSRIGMMSYQLMKGLYNAPLPRVITVSVDGRQVRLRVTPEIEEKLREDFLEGPAEIVRQDAIQAFTLCLDGATQNNWYNEWSARCESYLSDLKPGSYPVSAEWKAEPSYEQPLIVPVNVIKSLQ